ECITAVFATVDTDGTEHVGMHHAAAQYFQPAVAGAQTAAIDIDFRRWLGKWKIGRTETQLQIRFEKCSQKCMHVATQLGKTDTLGLIKPVDLVKHGAVGTVRITAVDTPWRDDAERRSA